MGQQQIFLVDYLFSEYQIQLVKSVNRNVKPEFILVTIRPNHFSEKKVGVHFHYHSHLEKDKTENVPDRNNLNDKVYEAAVKEGKKIAGERGLKFEDKTLRATLSKLRRN